MRAGPWLLSFALATSVACTKKHEDGHAAERQKRAEAELVRFGAGRFTVLTFSADPEREIEIRDDYDLPIRLYEVPFAGRVRFTARVEAPAPEQWRSRVGTPGWTVERMVDDAQAFMLFGDGRHEPGDEVDVDAAVMFERLENDAWRFRGLDRPR